MNLLRGPRRLEVVAGCLDGTRSPFNGGYWRMARWPEGDGMRNDTPEWLATGQRCLCAARAVDLASSLGAACGSREVGS